MILPRYKLNKRAIMVDFLVTILLALIIFIPTCAFVSNFFRLSAQAEDNFGDFTKEIKAMQESPSGERKTALIILDKETAIVYFSPSADTVKVEVDGFAGRNYEVLFPKPPRCMEKPCICLFRDTTIKDVGGIVLNQTAFVKSTFSNCRELPVEVKMLDCGIGKAQSVNSYMCSNGFVIERLLIKKAWKEISFDPAPFEAYYETQRRIKLQLTKQDNIILVEGEKYE